MGDCPFCSPFLIIGELGGYEVLFIGTGTADYVINEYGDI